MKIRGLLFSILFFYYIWICYRSVTIIDMNSRVKINYWCQAETVIIFITVVKIRQAIFRLMTVRKQHEVQNILLKN